MSVEIIVNETPISVTVETEPITVTVPDSIDVTIAASVDVIEVSDALGKAGGWVEEGNEDE